MEFTIGDWLQIIVAGSVIVAAGELAARLALAFIAWLQYKKRTKQVAESTDLASEIQQMFAQRFQSAETDDDSDSTG